MSVFVSHFGVLPARTVVTPGRVNLLGEWVDFSGGLVLPMSLPLAVTIEASPNGTGEDVVVSAQFEGEARFGVDAPPARHWADYVRGALQLARAEGLIAGGYNVALASTVPHGSGLSTSAAVSVGTLLAVLAETPAPDLVKVSVMARKVENDFIGVPCGIMDQMAVALAPAGKVLALDTGTLEFDLIDLPADWHVSVIHSGVSRELADGRYAERRGECLAAAEAIGVDELCKGDLAAASALPAPLNLRAQHVISEDVRTRAAVAHLKSGDRAAFGAAMNEGHASIRDDFEITTPEVDALVADAVALGADGARQTGGGFGGCIVAVLDPAKVDTWWPALQARHPKARLIV